MYIHGLHANICLCPYGNTSIKRVQSSLDVIIEPPAVHELTDEDSGEEGQGDPSRMSDNQLNAMAGYQRPKRCRRVDMNDDTSDELQPAAEKVKRNKQM